MTRPRLRANLVVVEQVYRGETTYIVKDPEAHKYFRFRPIEMMVMQEFDGQRTPAALAAALADQGLPFTVAAVEGFAHKLTEMGLLERSLAQKSVLLLERLRAQRRRRLRGAPTEGSLLRLRWSVGDPDAFLDRWMPRLRFCFSRPFLSASVVLFAVYGLVAALRWPELVTGIAALYTPSSYTWGNLVVLYLTAMGIVAIHELGHGFTCKYFGGHVHEMGAMLIYFQPAFYCNVNDAWTFPALRARLWVTAAGSWIQLTLAGLAAIVWWFAAPDTLLAQVALYAVILGGATTILANANPLIPLDGYYALSDWLEIPNLRQRAFEYLGWVVRHKVLRLTVPQPAADERERRVFAIYGTLALLYSTVILLLVFGFAFGWVSHTLGALGGLAVVLLAWAALRERLRAGSRTLLTALREHRHNWLGPGRVRRAAIGVAAAVLLAVIIPWPITVRGSFAVAPTLELPLRAPEQAVITAALAREGEPVPAGALLLQLRSWTLDREALRAGRLADSLAALVAIARAQGDPARAGRLEAEQGQWTALREGIAARRRALTLRAPTSGVVLTPRPAELAGRPVARGDTVLRFAAGDSVEVRVQLRGPGASLVAAGQPTSLVSYGAVGQAVAARVATVAATAPEAVEARVRLPADAAAWRPGARGEARITVRQSHVLGALWWAVRKRIRSDLLL